MISIFKVKHIWTEQIWFLHLVCGVIANYVGDALFPGFTIYWVTRTCVGVREGISMVSCASFARNSGHSETFGKSNHYNLTIVTVPHHVLDMNRYVLFARQLYESSWQAKRASLPPVLKPTQFKWTVTSASNPIVPWGLERNHRKQHERTTSYRLLDRALNRRIESLSTRSCVFYGTWSFYVYQYSASFIHSPIFFPSLLYFFMRFFVVHFPVVFMNYRSSLPFCFHEWFVCCPVTTQPDHGCFGCPLRSRQLQDQSLGWSNFVALTLNTPASATVCLDIPNRSSIPGAIMFLKKWH